jgi:DHA2 family multidrug resistance protein
MVAAALPADGAVDRNSPIDWIAIALLGIGLGCFQTFLEEGYSDDWFDSPFITTMAILAVSGIVLFIVRQLTAKHPVVDLSVLRYRSLAAGSVLSVIIGMALYGAMFAVPIFASSVLRLTAQEIGFLMLPGALGTAFMMLIASALVRRFDPRIVLALGAVVLTLAVVWMGRLTSSTSSGDLFGPLLVRAFGTALMFVPLSMAALGSIPKKDIAAASGLYNLTRQLGGSVGVALLSTLLGGRTLFHHAVLAEKLSATDPAVQSRVAILTNAMLVKGADTISAKQRALSMIEGSVFRESSVLAFNDTFWITAVLIVCSIPLIFVLGKPQKTGAASASAH